MKQIFTLLFMLATAACIQVKDLEKTATPLSPDFQSQNQKRYDLRSVTVDQTDKPNSYFLKIQRTSEDLLIEKTVVTDSDESNSKMLLDFNENSYSNDQITDYQIQPGLTYQLTWKVRNGNDLENVHEETVTIPEDLVLSGNIVLTQDTNWIGYKRVYSLPNTMITTMGYKLFVQTEQLFTEDLVLQTFPTEHQLPGKGSGKAGGKIEFETQSGQGRVFVYMRGEIGKVGRRGADQHCGGGAGIDQGHGPGFPGENGGDSGLFYAKIHQDHRLAFAVQVLAGPPGPGGDPGLVCHSSSQPRASGPNGQPGRYQQACIQDFKSALCN